MRIKIIDDSKTDAERLRQMCSLYFRQKKEAISVTAPTFELLTAYDPGMDLTADLLFLDIEMPGMSGLAIKDALEAESCLDEEQPGPYIIFVTGYGEYMQEAFGRNVIAFLQKPVERRELEKALERVVKQLESRRTVDCGDGACVRLQEIRYIRADHVYTVLQMGERERVVRRSLREWQALLEDAGFYRISEQTMVNLRWVQEVRGLEVFLQASKERLAVSRRRKKELLEAIKRYRERTVRYV